MDHFETYTMREIVDAPHLGKTEWGVIFKNNGQLRQSIDFEEGVVIVEKYARNRWDTFSSYNVGHVKKVMENKDGK